MRASVGRIIAHLGALLATSAAALVSFAGAAPASIDDAFVVLVYVKHFTASGSFYYNSGEGHVEGFTSLLDVLVKSGAVALTGGDPIGIAWWCALAAHLGAATLAYVIGVRLFRRGGVSLAVRVAGGALLGIAVAASPPLAYGSSFLLETPLFAICALASVGLFALTPDLPSRHQLSVLALSLPLLALVRPEGVLLAILVGVAARWSSPRGGGWVLLASMTCALVLFAFRLSYFGVHWPNSYYAKTSDSRLNEIRDGLRYVTQYWHSHEGLLLLSFPVAVVVSVSAPFGENADRIRGGLLASIATLSSCAVIVGGGDCYAGGRFLAVPLCLAMLALTALAAALEGMWRHLLLATLLAFCAGEISIGFKAGALARLQPLSDDNFACDRRIAAQLKTIAGDGEIAQTDYQRLKYFEDDLRVLDLTGLNNTAIAHRPMRSPVSFGKIDLLDVIRRRSRLWVLGHHVGVQPEPLSDFSLRDVLRTRVLHDQYFGYGIAPDLIDPVTNAYETASIAACGGYFSVLVQRDSRRALRVLVPSKPF